MEPPRIFPQFWGNHGWGLDIQGVVRTSLPPSSNADLHDSVERGPDSPEDLAGHDVTTETGEPVLDDECRSLRAEVAHL